MTAKTPNSSIALHLHTLSGYVSKGIPHEDLNLAYPHIYVIFTLSLCSLHSQPNVMLV